ncbi:MAG: outer membrane beta-barrel protein [Lewinellaceae bacterium]|nr:outer membrane beta-barrel protein [Lewinellaceae bacterium]
MKNLLFAWTFAILALFAASNSYAQTQIETKVGLSLFDMNWVDGGQNIDIKMATGILLGAKIDFGLSDHLKLSTGLEVIQKGGDVRQFDTVYFRPNYLQIPVQLYYRQGGFFAGAGPYLGIGLGGRFKYLDNGKTYNFPLTWSADQDAIYQRVDIGGTLEAGYQLRKIRVTASYGFSMVNNASAMFRDENKVHHKNFGISLGYVWGKNPVKIALPVQLIAKAGLNIADMDINTNGKDIDIKTTPGFVVGTTAEFSLSRKLGLGLGLELSQKGGIREDLDTTYYYPIYLQFPVQLFFHHGGFFVGAGPYLGVGIGGSVNTRAMRSILIEQAEFNNTPRASFRRLDVGAGLEVGYQFGRFLTSASYSLSLSNNAPELYGDALNIRHRVFGISLGYVFKKKQE